LHTDRILYKGALTNFSQTINSEFEGWQFLLVKEDEGFLNIFEIDSANLTIQGNFKAFFEVTDKKGHGNTKLPERITFSFYHFQNIIWIHRFKITRFNSLL